MSVLIKGGRVITAADDYVAVVRRLGLGRSEATRLVEQAWPV